VANVVVAAVVMLGILIVLALVHELGHFFVAKKLGIGVEELGLGFPPRLLSIKRSGTVYSINALPLGGFVKVSGETDLSVPGGMASRGIPARLGVLIAGSFMNAIFPILLFSIAYVIPHRLLVETLVVAEVIPDSPAALAGVQVGDQITQVDWSTIHNLQDLRFRIYVNLGRQIDFAVMHPDKTIAHLQLAPRWRAPEDDTATGLVVVSVNPQKIERRYAFWQALPLGLSETIDSFMAFKNAMVSMLFKITPVVLTGPVGLTQIVGEMAKSGLYAILQFAAFLSVNLAIINMFPLPALDGGRIAFLVLEWVRRGRRISAKAEGLVHGIGFALLLAVVAIITYQDVLRILHEASPLK
jgi:regulator of sigma E protease